MKTSTPLTSGKLLPFSVEKNNFCSQFTAFRLFPPLFSLFAVLGIVFSIVPSSALVLQWDKSPEPDVSGYKVYYGLASTTPSVVDRGTNRSCTFSSLTAGQSYSFYVTAYNSAGLESNPSSPFSYPVPQPTPAVPIISDIVDRSPLQTTATPSIAFLVNDLDTPPANLTLSAA